MSVAIILVLLFAHQVALSHAAQPLSEEIKDSARTESIVLSTATHLKYFRKGPAALCFSGNHRRHKGGHNWNRGGNQAGPNHTKSQGSDFP